MHRNTHIETNIKRQSERKLVKLGGGVVKLPWIREQLPVLHAIKLAFHGTDTDILARIVARMSACRSACQRNNFRKSRVSDVSARILARMSVSASVLVSASWNASLMAGAEWNESKTKLS